MDKHVSRRQGQRAAVDEVPHPEGKQLREVQRRLRDLQLENLEIKQALNQIAQANVLPGIVQNGFDNMIAELRPLRDLTAQANVLPGIVQNVIAELRPLRDLTPERVSLEQPSAGAVAGMLAAMQGVSLASESLGIGEVDVPFIGAVAVPAAGQANPNQALVRPNRQAFRGGVPL